MLHVLKSIICYTFDDLIGRMQYEKHLRGEDMIAMEIGFCVHDKQRECKYPKVELLIFGASNYVGVYFRESETREEFGAYQHLSRHDSCWRSDGVEKFLRSFEDKIYGLDWHGDGICNNKWYNRKIISEEMYHELRAITKKAQGGVC